ncbi:hypothetical protein PENANT_c004G01628 [Penicillium antarcticum]|uniref:Agmatine deiminase n=1 Tax=Penicillium antarcticum TaxID=416450 RepID=A0A1V6QH31_9EURO|nr:uncharacterized protein N7508_002314 [Penicillium antarcticum]KAJ5317806.1 hypothetical protein N7508_002314 [Penicillium antarcticum]OQD88176.1 hypothetical protein PENANT_c004G01628 [Penicillium antarcticum]
MFEFGFNEWDDKKSGDDGICWSQQWPLMNDDVLRENTEFAWRVVRHDCIPSAVTQIDVPVRAESGALVLDGEGTLLITKSSVFCDKRNPGMTKGNIEAELKRLLGIKKVICFPGRRNMDITDVHMDAEARVVHRHKIAHLKPHAIAIDLWQELAAEIREVLGRETDAKGRRLQIHRIEEPDPRGLVMSDHDELSASYVNIYLVNGCVVISQFGDEERDQNALEILQGVAFGRVIRQVNASAIPLTGGVLHCVA